MCPIIQERRDEVEDDEVVECNVFQRLRVKKGMIIVPGGRFRIFRGWGQVTKSKGLPVSPAMFAMIVINLTLFSKLLELH